MKGGKSLLLTVYELDFWPILTYRLEESNPATLEWSKRPLHWWKFWEENENIFFGPTYYISLCKIYSISNTFTLFFAYYDILKIESFWCWFFGWTIWKVLWSWFLPSLAPVYSLESWTFFLFANSGIMPLFLPRLLTWNFKKFLAAKKIIAALILGSESNIFRRCSWHFTSASTFSLSSGNPITSVSSLQQMKSSVILVKSCADYNTFSFPSQAGLF